MDSERQYLTLDEAAEFLNLKPSRLRYEVFRKSVPFIKIGRSIRFERAELIAWVEKLRNVPTKPPRQLAKEFSEVRRWARKTIGRR